MGLALDRTIIWRLAANEGNYCPAGVFWTAVGRRSSFYKAHEVGDRRFSLSISTTPADWLTDGRSRVGPTCGVGPVCSLAVKPKPRTRSSGRCFEAVGLSDWPMERIRRCTSDARSSAALTTERMCPVTAKLGSLSHCWQEVNRYNRRSAITPNVSGGFSLNLENK